MKPATLSTMLRDMSEAACRDIPWTVVKTCELAAERIEALEKERDEWRASSLNHQHQADVKQIQLWNWLEEWEKQKGEKRKGLQA